MFPLDDYGTYRTPEQCAEIEQARMKAATKIYHGCHECGEERLPRIVAGKLTCPICGSERIVSLGQ